LEQVITNIGLLNKNLESVIAVGKEFENAAALWKSFNNVSNNVSV
jgi:DASH complex subunit DAD1